MKSGFLIKVGILSLALAISAGCLTREPHPPRTRRTGDPAGTTGSSQFFDHYERVFRKRLARDDCPGAALVVVKDASVIFSKGFGVTEKYSGHPVDEETVFRIGSLSKGFASVLAAKLISEGHFSWNDRVTDHLPFFTLSSEEQAEEIEIRHLLSHTTGLPPHSYTNLIEAGFSSKDVALRLDQVDLTAKQGVLYSYQNAAYALIEDVIKTVTGKEYRDILLEEIIRPLGMRDSSTTLAEIKANSNTALPHDFSYTSRSFRKISLSSKYYNVVSAGGINASIRDMGCWLQLLLGNRPDIIENSALDDIFTPLINTDRDRRYYNKWHEVENTSYALGWRILDYNSREIIYHGGYVNGYRSELAIDRKNRLALCALFNAPCDYSNTVIPSFFGLCQLYHEHLRDPASDTKD